jgi:hypothetical protein
MWYNAFMQRNIPKKMAYGLILAALWIASPLYGADSRNTPVEVNLIIDGSGAFKSALNEAVSWISGNLMDHVLQEGDRISIWNAGGSARIIYSDTLKGADWKEALTNTLKSLKPEGNTADFAGALRDAASRTSDRNISYTLLISGSPAALSPTLLGSGANLVKFSRVEEFRSWRLLVIGLNIDSKVRQAASAYLSGI